MSRDLWVGRQSVRLLHRASKHHGVSDMQIVGIDCAAQPKNTGYAYFDGDVVMAIGAGVKNPAADIVDLVDWASPRVDRDGCFPWLARGHGVDARRSSSGRTHRDTSE